MFPCFCSMIFSSFFFFGDNFVCLLSMVLSHLRVLTSIMKSTCKFWCIFQLWFPIIYYRSQNEIPFPSYADRIRFSVPFFVLSDLLIFHRCVRCYRLNVVSGYIFVLFFCLWWRCSVGAMLGSVLFSFVVFRRRYLEANQYLFSFFFFYSFLFLRKLSIFFFRLCVLILFRFEPCFCILSPMYNASIKICLVLTFFFSLSSCFSLFVFLRVSNALVEWKGKFLNIYMWE